MSIQQRLIREDYANLPASAEDLKKLTDLLDTRFKLPFGMRVGWDGILGIIPGVGDVVPTLMSLYIVVRSASMGAPVSVLSRMGINVLIDNVLDTIPLIGWIFDMAYKSNVKNLRLLNAYMAEPHKVKRRSTVLVIGVIAVVIIGSFLMMVLGVYLAYLVIQGLVGRF